MKGVGFSDFEPGEGLAFGGHSIGEFGELFFFFEEFGAEGIPFFAGDDFMFDFRHCLHVSQQVSDGRWQYVDGSKQVAEDLSVEC